MAKKPIRRPAPPATRTACSQQLPPNWGPPPAPTTAMSTERMQRYLSNFTKRSHSGPLRILYLSCHGPLEHDELKLFGALGCEWVCLAESDPITRPRASVRDEKLLGCNVDLQTKFSTVNPSAVPSELLKWADVVIAMHRQSWLHAYAGVKPLIWRSIGQANSEIMLAPFRPNIFCVRMSPREAAVRGYVGTDALIRFYKDPDEFTTWRGCEASSVAVMGMVNVRRMHNARVDLLEHLLRSAKSTLYGLNTDRDLPGIGRGTVGYEELKEHLRDARVFITVGSYPGPYTLSLIEAMMTGCPVVSIGRQLWSGAFQGDVHLCETHEILSGCGVVSEDLNLLQGEVFRLISQGDAGGLGAKGRARAIELFGKETALANWRAILDPIANR